MAITKSPGDYNKSADPPMLSDFAQPWFDGPMLGLSQNMDITPIGDSDGNSLVPRMI